MSQSGMSSSKLYSIPINRFTTSELPHFKQKLLQHKNALSELKYKCNWPGVHQEQIKASSTLRKFKRSLQDLENVKSRLDINQQPDFEQLLIPLRESANKSVRDFAAFQKRVEATAAEAANSAALSGSYPAFTAGEADQQQLLQRQLVVNEQLLLQQRQEQLTAFENLERDAADLNEIFVDLAAMTAEQRQQVDQVEENVATTQENVTEGARQLAAAARLSGGVAPVTGAVIGGLVAGPLGLVVGAKVASVAAVGGGLLGYLGGQMVNTARRSGPDIPEDAPSRPSSAPGHPDPPSSSLSSSFSAGAGALRRLTVWLGSEWVGLAFCPRRTGLELCCGRITAGGGSGGTAPAAAAAAAGGGNGGGHVGSNTNRSAGGRPHRPPEQPLDPLLAEDVDTDAVDAAALSEPPTGRGLLPPTPL